MTQFSHVSRHPRVYNKKKTKKIFWENCFDNGISNLWKTSYCVHKSAYRKSLKTKKQLKTKNHKKTFLIFVGL